MPKHRLVISVTGGTVEDVLTDAPDLEVILCDSDIDGPTKDDIPDIVKFKVQGRVHFALVAPMATAPLPTSPNSLVGTALKAAGLDQQLALVASNLTDRELATVLAALRCFQDDFRECKRRSNSAARGGADGRSKSVAPALLARIRKADLRLPSVSSLTIRERSPCCEICITGLKAVVLS